MELGLLRHLVDELKPLLEGTRTDRVYAVPRYDLVIETSSRRHFLWLSLDPADPHVCHRRRGPKSEQRPPAFAMAARKWARGRELEAVELVDDDRVLRLAWRGGGSLIAELVPRRATAFVVDDADKVVAVWNPRKGRPGIGDTYSAPDRRRRESPTATAPLEWARLAGLESAELRRALVQHFEDMSPTTAAEVLHRAPQGPEQLRSAVLEELQRDREPVVPRIYSAAPLAELREPVGPDKLLCSTRVLAHREHQCVREFDSVADATRFFYDLTARLRLIHQARLAVRRQVDDRVARLKRRQRGSPQASEDRIAARRRQADCLLACPDAPVVNGAAEVPDVYAQNETVRISVDPAKSIPDNAQSLYRRAQRLEERARRSVHESEVAKREIARLTDLRDRADAVATADQLDDLLAAAETAGLDVPRERLRLAEAGTGHLQVTPDAPERPGGGVLSVTTLEGHQILVGRSATQNDRLTHQLAQPHDWWLHAEGPGSHVVLRNPRRLEQPPPDALAAAASLAAWFSKARNAGKVEVKWTSARRVRKPRGAPAGLAVLDSYHTFVAAPRPPAEVGQTPEDQ